MRTIALLATVTVSAFAADLPTKSEVEDLVTKGQNFLLAQQQPNGAFVPGRKFTLGISGLVVEALAKQPLGKSAADPIMVKGLAFIDGFKQPNGSVANPEEGIENYTTSIALQVWAATGSTAAADIKKAQDFLLGIQNVKPGDRCEGGIGYGSRGAGNEDLSNTAYAVAALRSTGVPADHPNLQKALGFIQRCHDLSSVNKLPWAKDSGGAVYTPDESKAGGSWMESKPGDPPAKMVPYASMTYTLISSYLALDLTKDDPRVLAAKGWVAKNYDGFKSNPGMPAGKELQGLFYTYAASAKALDLLDASTLTTGDGRTVDWRADLFAAIKDRANVKDQTAFWINSEKRWGEDTPHLVTTYVVRALKRIHESL